LKSEALASHWFQPSSSSWLWRRQRAYLVNAASPDMAKVPAWLNDVGGIGLFRQPRSGEEYPKSSEGSYPTHDTSFISACILFLGRISPHNPWRLEAMRSAEFTWPHRISGNVYRHPGIQALIGREAPPRNLRGRPGAQQSYGWCWMVSPFLVLRRWQPSTGCALAR